MFFQVCCKNIDTAEKPPTFLNYSEVSRIKSHIYKRVGLWYDECRRNIMIF